MADEHESNVAAWLNDKSAQREVKILKKKFPAWKEADVYLFALMVEILTGMDFYGEPLLAEFEDEGPDDDPWKQDGDATGWKP